MNLQFWFSGVEKYGVSSKVVKNFLDNNIVIYNNELVEDLFSNGPVLMKMRFDLLGWDFYNVYYVALSSNNFLRNVVLSNLSFFKDLVVRKGPKFVRMMFDIVDDKFDGYFEELNDFLFVASGAVFEYVDLHLDEIRKGGFGKLRDELFLSSKKYDGIWRDVQNYFLDKLSVSIATEKNLTEYSVLLFEDLMNITREKGEL